MTAYTICSCRLGNTLGQLYDRSCNTRSVTYKMFPFLAARCKKWQSIINCCQPLLQSLPYTAFPDPVTAILICSQQIFSGVRVKHNYFAHTSLPGVCTQLVTAWVMQQDGSEGIHQSKNNLHNAIS